MSAMNPRAWQFAHNMFAHPLMELTPEVVGNWLHDMTAERAFIAQESGQVATTFADVLNLIRAFFSDILQRLIDAFV